MSSSYDESNPKLRVNGVLDTNPMSLFMAYLWHWTKHLDYMNPMLALLGKGCSYFADDIFKGIC